jgi:uncharacterized protein
VSSQAGSRATLAFRGDLAALADAGRDGLVTVPVRSGPRSVKDAIESCGVPHTEVDLVEVDGASCGFDRLLVGGETVVVHPWSPSNARRSRVRPPHRPPRFVLDVHLGRLAELLRHLGFDTRYANDTPDDRLVAVADADQRWLLTRDRGLLRRRVVTHGYLVRHHDPHRQAAEVVRRFDLAGLGAPLSRCARCNGRLTAVRKADVAHLLPPATRREQTAFVRCTGCGQLYWPGSHLAPLQDLLRRLAG